MCRKNDAKSFFRQSADAVHYKNHISVIQIGCRLIQDQDLRFLRQRPSDHQKLPLAAGYICINFIPQMTDAYCLQCLLHDLIIFFRRLSKGADLSQTPQHGNVPYQIRKSRDMRLFHISHCSGHFFRRPFFNILAIDTDLSL